MWEKKDQVERNTASWLRFVISHKSVANFSNVHSCLASFPPPFSSLLFHIIDTHPSWDLTMQHFQLEVEVLMISLGSLSAGCLNFLIFIYKKDSSLINKNTSCLVHLPSCLFYLSVASCILQGCTSQRNDLKLIRV